MRCGLILIILLGLGWCPAATNEAVVIGDLHEDSLLNLGRHWQTSFLQAGTRDEFHHLLSICLDVEDAPALMADCARRLEAIIPRPSVLVHGFHVAASQSRTPWQLAIGEEVPAVFVCRVLTAIRARHPGPLILHPGADTPTILSYGPTLSAETPAPTDPALLQRLENPQLQQAELQAVLEGLRPAPRPAAVPEPPQLIADLDLCSQDGQPPADGRRLACQGVTWTRDGLYLPGRRLAVIPSHFPPREEDFFSPITHYRADLTLPPPARRALTVTLLVCPASNGLGQDNLFSVGRRSRWFTAQVGRNGGVVIGLGDRWNLHAMTLADGSPLAVTPGRWHAITVGVDGDGPLLRAVVDDRVASGSTLIIPASALTAPRPVALDGDGVISLAEYGTNRHLHGLVRRLIVHRGLLTPDTITALHRNLDPGSLPAPTVPEFARPVAPTLLPDPGPAEALPGADRF